MVIHPLLRLVMSHPHLVAEHAENYAALVKDEMSKLSRTLAVRAGLYAGAGVFALIGLLLVGVALLLAAALPHEQFTARWALYVVPLTPLVLSALMVILAQTKQLQEPFAVVKKQFGADLAMVRESTTS